MIEYAEFFYCNKFSNEENTGTGFINAYLGNDRVKGESYSTTGNGSSDSIIGAKNPRFLKDFEYFGNNKKFKDGSTIAQNNKSCVRAAAKFFV